MTWHHNISQVTSKSHAVSMQAMTCDSHHHHHQACAPSWSIAVSMRCFQCSRSWAYFQAELRPRLWGWRSAPRVRSHMWRGRPGGRFQSVGRPRIDVLSALEMSSDASIPATWPKSQSHLLWISWDSCGGEPARNRTVALATWSVYGIWRMRRRQMLSKASTLSSKAPC